MTWINIHIKPKINNPGLSKIANASIFIPIVATKTYKKTLPIVEAPAPSYFLNLVNDKVRPPVVAITINQKNELVKLNFSK